MSDEFVDVERDVCNQMHYPFRIWSLLSDVFQ